jgi:mono/diheme cytochrome c family protein
MSRNMVGALLLVFFAVLAIGYAGVMPFGGDGGPREVSDDNGLAANGDPVAVGESIYSQQCSGCHTIDGSSGVGPTLAGLYGSEVTMEDGETYVADGEYLIMAITDPRATTREGYLDVMPSFDNLSEDEIAGLVAFIESLE